MGGFVSGSASGSRPDHSPVRRQRPACLRDGVGNHFAMPFSAQEHADLELDAFDKPAMEDATEEPLEFDGYQDAGQGPAQSLDATVAGAVHPSSAVPMDAILVHRRRQQSAIRIAERRADRLTAQAQVSIGHRP